ncbi:unnamed protein product [Hyaloperonospora brassicae]|uniref:RING-type domain-containing protein n=1 Tax=Hyaloperonospora brassicae TaxID=162125 RepID=A0AAV0U5M0_HYABA|nr:unnamed protein product [Hyaloperonospora brassicae]
MRSHTRLVQMGLQLLLDPVHWPLTHACDLLSSREAARCVSSRRLHDAEARVDSTHTNGLWLPRVRAVRAHVVMLYRDGRENAVDSCADAEAVESSSDALVDDFAEEIESEASEIRMLIARTAQLWSAVDQEEHREDVVPDVRQQLFPGASPPRALHTLLPAEDACVENDTSTLSSDDDAFDWGDEQDGKTDSVEMDLYSMTRGGREDASSADAFGRSTGSICSSRLCLFGASVEQRGVAGRSHDVSSDSGCESVTLGRQSDESARDSDELRLEQDEVVGASIRALNASKASVLQDAVLTNLIRLGFREDVTRVALETGVFEIDQYGSDFELEYADIFMSLVKMVCDAHVDVRSDGNDDRRQWAPCDVSFDSHEPYDTTDANQVTDPEQISFLPFKWPVFDMAQFEFGNARPGTCFNSVCVLINLPKVPMDRTDELMKLLSCSLFCMIDDPIQVAIPSARSTGRTKGHAFLEFDDPVIAQRCAVAVDGLTWGKGPSCRIRGNLFRRYEAKVSAAKRRLAPMMNEDEASPPRLLSGVLHSRSVTDTASGCPHTLEHHHSRFSIDIVQQQYLTDSDDDSRDTGELLIGHPTEYAQFNVSPVLDLSSGSVDSEAQEGHIQLDHAIQLGWDDTIVDAGYRMQQQRHDEDDDEMREVGANNSVLTLQRRDEGNLMSQSLVDEYDDDNLACSQTRVSLSFDEALEASSSLASTSSAMEHEPYADCDTIEHSDSILDANDGTGKPWRRYCEDLIVCNRDMQEQISLARIRIVQLSRNNQKLHLLADRVERDRDGLLYENDLLQTQLYGHEDHKRRYDSMMKELVSLRTLVTRQEQSLCAQIPDREHFTAACTRDNPSGTALSSTDSMQAALSSLRSVSLANCKFQELKEWEQQLESTLSQVRSIKEERALEMQKKLDRQVEEQNELKLCVICLCNEKRILCLPCRHLCLCETCSHRQEVTKCPICRLEIEEVLAVYS